MTFESYYDADPVSGGWVFHLITECKKDDGTCRYNEWDALKDILALIPEADRVVAVWDVLEPL
jgi:hypothetical protein